MTHEKLERIETDNERVERALIAIMIALDLYHSLAEWYACGDDLI